MSPSLLPPPPPAPAPLTLLLLLLLLMMLSSDRTVCFLGLSIFCTSSVATVAPPSLPPSDWSVLPSNQPINSDACMCTHVRPCSRTPHVMSDKQLSQSQQLNGPCLRFFVFTKCTRSRGRCRAGDGAFCALSVDYSNMLVMEASRVHPMKATYGSCFVDVPK